MDFENLIPQSRFEKILSGEDLEPQSREEYFLKMAAGGSGSGMNYYLVTMRDNVFYHDNIPQTYEMLKNVFEDETKFLYLMLNNLVYIPSIVVEGENGAISFNTTWVRNDGDWDSGDPYRPYISRVMINSDDDVNMSEFELARADMNVGASIIEVGSAQFTFDEKVFPKIPLAIAKNVYDTYTSGKPVIIRWRVMNAIPVEASVIGSDYVNGKKSFNVLIHDNYSVEYSYTDETTNYADTNVVNLAGGGGSLYQHIIQFNIYNDDNDFYGSTIIISQSPTQYNRESLKNYIIDNIGDYTDDNYNYYPCSMTNENKQCVHGLGFNGENNTFVLVYYDAEINCSYNHNYIQDTVIKL